MTVQTHNTYTAIGRQRFAISFKYREADELVVTVDDVTKALGTDYQVIASTNTVLFASPVTGEVKLQRTTDIATSAIAVDFTTLTYVSSSELNEVFEKQVLYGFQEVKMDEIVPMQAMVLIAKTNNLSDLTSNSLARSNLGVYSVSELDAKMDPVISGSLVFANNLSDVADVSTTRDNLSLGNKAYTDAQIAGVLKAENNLSDLDSLSAARSSLDVYSKGAIDTKLDQDTYDELYMDSADNLNLLPNVSTSRDNISVDSKEELDTKMATLQALATAHPPAPTPPGGLISTTTYEEPLDAVYQTDLAIPANADYFTCTLRGGHSNSVNGGELIGAPRALPTANDFDELSVIRWGYSEGAEDGTVSISPRAGGSTYEMLLRAEGGKQNGDAFTQDWDPIDGQTDTENNRTITATAMYVQIKFYSGTP